MRKILVCAAMGGAMMLGACATSGTVKDIHGEAIPVTAGPEIDPSWQRMHLQVTKGSKHADNMVFFAPDGRLRVQFTNSNRGVNGHWFVRPGLLCLQLPIRGTECFSYTRMLQKDETIQITSNRGWTGNVTMMTDATGTSLSQAMAMAPTAPPRRRR